ncbi:hypothetical protein SFC79_05515 [Nocardioides sp. S-58]|uniref:Uncharacterized protein n=1 Tax=Nocardioides renjunii TaxID=3095075 RepID=A0ABU5K8J4_9ACTN|nr:hypothetical protein [Nocardioides sp. S-58]MDZ5661217.1 hypothetical protein [Nocardioides sp. S-58]
MSVTPDDPFVAHTGSPEAALLLRRNLTAIADENRGTATGRLVRDVLAGQRDLGDLEHDADFMALVRGGVRQYEDHLASLSPEEKERLYADARELAEVDTSDGGPAPTR